MRKSAQTKSKPGSAAPRPNDGASLLASHIKAIRKECSDAMRILRSGKPLGELQLRRCAQLGDSMNVTQQVLQSTVAYIAISRIKRGASSSI